MHSFLIQTVLAVLLVCQLTNGLEDIESTRTVSVETEPTQKAVHLLVIDDDSQGQDENKAPRVTRQFGGFGGPGFGGFGPQAAYFGDGGFPPPGFGYGGGYGGGFGGGYGGGFQRVRTVTRTRVVNRLRGGGFGGGYGGGFYG